MSIIAILAGMVLGALYGSAESARKQNTQSVVLKLHNRLMARYETYATRRVPMDPSLPLPGRGDDEVGVTLGHESIWSTGNAAKDDPHNMALRRLWGMRELMRYEMPDQYADLFAVPLFLPKDTNNLPLNSLFVSYRLRLNDAVQALVGSPGVPDEAAALSKITAENESSECLYMILSTPFGDEGAGAGGFAQPDVGDTDSDGMPEFVDGWGNPIEWIRWPAGFVSDLQPLAGTDLDGDGKLNDRDRTRDWDPLDPRGLDQQDYTDNTQDGMPRGYRLTPLVMSSGPDGEFGLAFRWNPEGNAKKVDPFAFLDPPDGSGEGPAQRGSARSSDGAHLDNIHSHLLLTQP